MKESIALTEIEVSPVTIQYYKLIYRHNKATHDIAFQYPGDLDSAINKAKQYCATFHQTFVNVEPLFFDLDQEMGRKIERSKIEHTPGRAY